MIYSLVPRSTIFDGDPVYSKMAGNPDTKANYQNTVYQKMGYLDYKNQAAIAKEATSSDAAFQSAIKNKTASVFEKWAKEHKGWKLQRLPLSKEYYATREISLIERVGRFYKKLIVIDHPWKVHDAKNKNLKRYVKITNSKSAGIALVGSGTQHKYLIYFNSQFPFVHQNIISLDLGTSYPTYSGREVTDVIGQRQGQTVSKDVTYDTGLTENSPVDIFSAEYQTPSQMSRMDKERYKDSYVPTQNNYNSPSMIGISFSMGVISIILAYAIGVPLAVLMARYKGKWIDRFGIGLITVLISVPSLAFIYFFRFVGSSALGLPDSFPTFGATDIRSYILPTVILGLLNISGLMIWVRRYMIDQQSADYVKFAKAKGLSNKEISRRHIFKNAMIPIVQGIPGSIILSIGGATITETVFAVPGMGKMLPDSITAHNNPTIIALVFVFTTLSVLSVLAGDIAMTIIDPRISLEKKGGE